MADADHRFIDLEAGKQKRKTPISTSAGAVDGGKIAKTDPATGKFHASLLPESSSADHQHIFEASEALSGGDQINIWDDAGTPKVRKADASDASKPADGWVDDAISSAASGTIKRYGHQTGLTGLTLGAEYYLATTPGEISTTAPSATGNLVQPIGVAISATELLNSANRKDGIEIE